jgi:hypothetical protein
MRVNATVTVLSPFIVNDCGFVVPVRLPDQVSKRESPFGVAVNVTMVPSLKEAVQATPQLSPLGDDVTVPSPVPTLMTVSAKDWGEGEEAPD